MFKKLREKFKNRKCDHFNSELIGCVQLVRANNKHVIAQQYKCNTCGKTYTVLK